MKKDTFSWTSKILERKMEVKTYGTYGFAVLLFPALSDDINEADENGLIDSVEHLIDKGKCKIFSVGGVNFDSWLNTEATNQEKSQLHLEYNNYLIEEVVPFIFGNCGTPVPIVTCGAAIGAFHAANNFFRRPDIFYGTIALSGTFNIEHYSKGYFDDNCYFNSPIHYLPNLTDNYWLSFLLNKRHIYLYTGSGFGEHPHNTLHLSGILQSKGIPHEPQIWGPEWHHDWDTWKAMLSLILEQKF
jgi:esterase/lipase superfamily enzyme